MYEKDNNVRSEEIREIMEIMAKLNLLSLEKCRAIKYYLKGRFDAEDGNIEIPLEFIKGGKLKASGV